MTTRQELRPGLLLDLSLRLSEAAKAVANSQDMTKSCISCKYFKEDTEFCTKYLGKPPARVIAYSCTSYDDDYIPF